MNTEQFDTFLNTEPALPVAATAVAVSSTETEVPSEETTPVVTAPPKRFYTRKQDMENGNNAILAALSFDATTALGKQEILAKLSAEDKALVSRNWNMRLDFLQETGEISSVGRKVSKKYFRQAQPA